MLFLNAQDFFDKTAGIPRLSREEERSLAAAMAADDTAARRRLTEGYLPMVAGHIRHCKSHLQTLTLVYACVQALEKAVDSFDFLQDSESFSHRLCWHLRQTTVQYIAQQRDCNL